MVNIFLFELVQGEIVQHLQVSHGVTGSKGMTEVVVDSMESTFSLCLRNHG